MKRSGDSNSDSNNCRWHRHSTLRVWQATIAIFVPAITDTSTLETAADSQGERFEPIAAVGDGTAQYRVTGECPFKQRKR